MEGRNRAIRCSVVARGGERVRGQGQGRKRKPQLERCGNEGIRSGQEEDYLPVFACLPSGLFCSGYASEILSSLYSSVIEGYR